MNLLAFNPWYLSRQLQQFRLMAFFGISVGSVLSTSSCLKQAERFHQQFTLHCELCSGSFFVTTNYEKSKYQALVDIENHIYYYTLSLNNKSVLKYRHLRCSVADLFICNQTLLTLKEKTNRNYRGEETQKYISELGIKVENGLNHLFHLLISLLDDETKPSDKNDENNIKETFYAIERLSFAPTLVYVISSIGQLRNKLYDKLSHFLSKCFVKNKDEVKTQLSYAFELVKLYEITNTNKVDLSELVGRHDTFFLPLLFSSTKLVDIYSIEELIEFVQKGDCFLKNQERRESAVFRHIFLACLINDIKNCNSKINKIPARLTKLCKQLYERQRSNFVGKFRNIKELACELDTLKADIERQPKKLKTFCFCMKKIHSTLQRLGKSLKRLKNGKPKRVMCDYNSTNKSYYMYYSYLSPKIVCKHYLFKTFVSFIWKYTNFSFKRRMNYSACSDYFNKYAVLDENSVDESKQYQQTVISYILLNYIFCCDGRYLLLQDLIKASRNNVKNQACGIYMITNYGVITQLYRVIP